MTTARSGIPRRVLRTVVLVGLALVAVTVAVSAWLLPTNPTGECVTGEGSKQGQAGLQLARTAERAEEILLCYAPADLDDLLEGLDRDTAYPVSYAAAIGYWAVVGRFVFRRAWLRRAAPVMAVAAVVAGACDLVENHFLRQVITHWREGSLDGDAVRNAFAFAAPKWVLLIVSLLYALAALGTTLVLLWRGRDAPAEPAPAGR